MIHFIIFKNLYEQHFTSEVVEVHQIHDFFCIRLNHPVEYPGRCLVCPKAYKTVKMLGQHRRNTHGITYGGGGGAGCGTAAAAAKKKVKKAGGNVKTEDFDITNNQDVKMETVKVMKIFILF